MHFLKESYESTYDSHIESTDNSNRKNSSPQVKSRHCENWKRWLFLYRKSEDANFALTILYDFQVMCCPFTGTKFFMITRECDLKESSCFSREVLRLNDDHVMIRRLKHYIVNFMTR